MDDRDVFEELLAEELESGMTRADVLKRGAAAGAGIYGLSALFGAGTAFAGMEARSLTPTFYQWIYGLYPDIPAKINKDYAKRTKLDAKIAPVQGFGIDRCDVVVHLRHAVESDGRGRACRIAHEG